MRKIYFLIVLSIIISAGLAGCSYLLTQKGALVRIATDSSIIKGCRPLGTVKGSASLGINKSQKTEMALKEIRNEAGLLGADTVLIISTESMFEGTSLRGKAYDCSDKTAR